MAESGVPSGGSQTDRFRQGQVYCGICHYWRPAYGATTKRKWGKYGGYTINVCRPCQVSRRMR